jgi:capsid protein
LIRWLRSLFAPERKPPRRTAAGLLADRYAAVKARYDAAITDESNKKHWANADGLSAAAANSHGVRDTLRRRSRYECDNGGYCAGIVRTRADDLVGTGPTLQILTDDDAINGQVERAFAGWARASCTAEKLHTLDMARCRDGESFGVFVTNPAVNHPVQLDLKLVEADQIADPVGGPPVPGRIDGIEYDAHGNPAAYHVLRFHPGGRWFDFAVPSSLTDFSAPGPYGEPVVNFSQPYAADRIDAQYVLHWFRKDRPGQLRGVPELTPALPLFPYLRRFTLATLAAAETAANLSAILETEYNPALAGEEPEPPTPMETLEIERGVMVTTPAGSKMHQFAAEHPNAEFANFRREIIKECGRPVGMPFNVTAADSSQHNYSSAKLDHYGYRGSLRVERHFAEVNLLDRVFAAFVAEARLIPGLLPAGVDVLVLPRAWHWPGWPSMDKDEAKNDTERLNNGTATLSELQAEWGVDWKESVRQRGRELKFMAEAGVPPPPQRTTPVGGADPTEAGAPAAATPAAGAGRAEGGDHGGNGRGYDFGARAAILEELLVRSCGGPGSGVPGPCPVGKPEPAPAPKEAPPAGRPAAGFPPADQNRQKTGAQLDKLDRDLREQTNGHLNASQRAAIKSYTGDAYTQINAEVRAGVTDGKQAEKIGQLHKALDGAPTLEKPVMVYRGMSLPEGAHAELTAKLKEAHATGGTVTMSGFLSTSTDVSVAREFSKGSGKSMLFEIKATKGVAAPPTSKYAEREFLLGDKSKFRVAGRKNVAIDRGGTLATVVQLEQVH